MKKHGCISYDERGAGRPLVLVHGGFSDHWTNWEFVLPLWEREFRVISIARRGRGESVRSVDHSVGDEARDVARLLASFDEPVTLLGHSYGAHVALAAARMVPERVAKLVLYEPPGRGINVEDAMERLGALAGDWDRFSATFFGEVLLVPVEELRQVRESELWAPIVADAPASWQDIQALARYRFDAEEFRGLSMPVLLQTGTESPGHLYATEALAAVLPQVERMPLEGQAHEGMTTAPGMYARRVADWIGVD